MIAGIDEAGRGPVIGPMVIAGVMIRESQIRTLKRIGVRDSKKLTPTMREEMAEKIRNIRGVEIHEEIVSPLEIDAAVRDRGINLNGLEIRRMARIVDRLLPRKVYIDLIGRSAEKFTKALLAHARHRPQVIARHRADDLYAVTAAASIIAKTTRDAELKRLGGIYAKRFGPIGSGYCHDPRTQAFLRRAIDETGIIRKSWSTYVNARAEMR